MYFDVRVMSCTFMIDQNRGAAGWQSPTSQQLCRATHCEVPALSTLTNIFTSSAAQLSHFLVLLSPQWDTSWRGVRGTARSRRLVGDISEMPTAHELLQAPQECAPQTQTCSHLFFHLLLLTSALNRLIEPLAHTAVFLR